MLNRQFLTTLPFMLLLASVTTADEPRSPETPQPSIRMAMVNEDGSLTVHVTHEMRVLETRVANIEIEEPRVIYENTNEGLKLKFITVTVTRQVEYIVSLPRWETREFRAPEGFFNGYTAKGELIAQADLAVRLKKISPVVISAERTNVIDPLFLTVLNERAVVLIVDHNLSPEDSSPPEAPAPPAEAPLPLAEPAPFGEEK